jgi:hypothetical protein
MPHLKLLIAQGGSLDAETLNDVLGLIGEQPVDFSRLSRRQVARVYDWAMREHLCASDNTDVKRRARPRCLRYARA